MSGYIGTQPVPQATQTRDAFTATSNQTSFATSGYTPNFLDVFLNGVKLAAADYTASNGSDVVLATGATTGDILEVVAYTTFDTANVTGAANFTVTGSFTSQGIDDNANATAITIDSSENVLVGTTDASIYSSSTASGISLRGSIGLLGASRGSNESANFNRYGTDGDIVKFRKDGSTVGSIGVAQSGDRTYFAGGSYGVASDTSDATIMPCNTTGGGNDGVVSLGKSDARFKDLYLSGGVYLGGTGSANKLDDYEFGNWTPAIQYQSGGPNTATQTSGSYTKIGGLVNVNGMMICGNTNSGSGLAYLAGLPFTVADVVANTSVEANGTVGYFANLGTTVNTISISAIANTNRCEIYLGTLSSSAIQGGVSTFNSGAQFRFSITYRTNS